MGKASTSWQARSALGGANSSTAPANHGQFLDAGYFRHERAKQIVVSLFHKSDGFPSNAGIQILLPEEAAQPQAPLGAAV
jgi:hypothetical protein